MTDSSDESPAEIAAEEDAAITWAAVDVSELTPFHLLGGGYLRPSDVPTRHTGVSGRPFMSWLLRSWLDAGLIEVWADEELASQDEIVGLGWLDRAVPERRWFILRTDDARTLVSDISLWSVSRATGTMFPTFSAAGEVAPNAEWHRIARQSETLAPPLGRDAGMSADVDI